MVPQKQELFICIINNGDDSFRFCDELGRTIAMYFEVFIPGDDLWDAVLRLKNPFKGEWGSDLVEGVEYAE